jgi:hypothetical protein
MLRWQSPCACHLMKWYRCEIVASFALPFPRAVSRLDDSEPLKTILSVERKVIIVRLGSLGVNRLWVVLLLDIYLGLGLLRNRFKLILLHEILNARLYMLKFSFFVLNGLHRWRSKNLLAIVIDFDCLPWNLRRLHHCPSEWLRVERISLGRP